MKRSIIGLFIGIMVILMLTMGCSKLTMENYDKIKTGMEYDEVVKILGKADTCESGLGAKSCVWGDKDKNITVNFLGNKVLISSNKGI